MAGRKGAGELIFSWWDAEERFDFWKDFWLDNGFPVAR
jgi:hypothetical protein